MPPNGEDTEAKSPEDNEGDDFSRAERENKAYLPIFFLTEVPDEYFDSLADFASSEEHLVLLEIRSEDSPINNDPDKILDEERRATRDDGLTPFLGCTVDGVYEFYKTRMRPLDHSTSLKHFTRFVFLAIDEECVTSTPRQCILCCDAPDYGEEDQEIKLESFRMPVEKALSHLCALEVLRITPSEVHESKDWVLFSMPPVMILPFEGPRAENGLYRVATPAEARINKRRAINFNPKIFEREFNDERPAVYSKCPGKGSQTYGRDGEGLQGCVEVVGYRDSVS